MLKKFLNRSESSQVVMNDSTLRDIIPSNDTLPIKIRKQKRLSTICKFVILVLILGLIATGIVALALILAFSGKSLMNSIMNPFQEDSSLLENKTRVGLVEDKKLIQNWTKISVLPIKDNQSVHITSSSATSMSTEQITSSTIQTTAHTFASTSLLDKIRVSETVLPLTTKYLLQSSTTDYQKKKLILSKYKNLEDDDMIDDFLYT